MLKILRFPRIVSKQMILLQLGILFELGLFQGVELWPLPEFKEKVNNVKCPGTLGESKYVHTVFTTKTRIFWQILPDLIDMKEFKRQIEFKHYIAHA